VRVVCEFTIYRRYSAMRSLNLLCMWINVHMWMMQFNVHLWSILYMRMIYPPWWLAFPCLKTWLRLPFHLTADRWLQIGLWYIHHLIAICLFNTIYIILTSCVPIVSGLWLETEWASLGVSIKNAFNCKISNENIVIIVLTFRIR
jgi:hypothetical protein